MKLLEVTALIGAITGTLGFVIALLVFFRDRAKVLVALQFDMQGFDGLQEVPEGYFVVRIYNVGRRPVYLSHAHIVFTKWAAKKFKVSHFVLTSGLAGITIPEGGAPHVIPTKQTDLPKYAKAWAYMRAAVSDAAGRTHYSDWPTVRPEWAGDHTLKCRVFVNKALNQLRRLRP